MKISEIKKKFKNTWVLMEVIKENELNQPIDVKPIKTSKDKNQIYDEIAKVPKGKTVDGLLGLSFLQHFKLNINFPKGELELE